MTEYEQVENPPGPPGAPTAPLYWTRGYLAHAKAHPGKWFVSPHLLAPGTAGTHQFNFKAAGYEATIRKDPDATGHRTHRIYVRWPEQ